MNHGVYFSECFDVERDVITDYGAVDISLVSDLPLFIDPFLLFDNDEYRNIHDEMIRYICFLQEEAFSGNGSLSRNREKWLKFREVKQTWLGYSFASNVGRGNGETFADELVRCLTSSIMTNFGEHPNAQSSHIERLALWQKGMGKDKISDFVTNFAVLYLIRYTERFAREHLDEADCRMFSIPHTHFNWETHVWDGGEYYLPNNHGEYVLLTPRNILRRIDVEMFLNRVDMINKMEDIGPALPNDELRDEFNGYISLILGENADGLTKKAKRDRFDAAIADNPRLIDLYFIYKEMQNNQADSSSERQVNSARYWLNDKVTELRNILTLHTSFYGSSNGDAGEYSADAKARLQQLKNAVENLNGRDAFYRDDKLLRSEDFLKRMMKLIWYIPGQDYAEMPIFMLASRKDLLGGLQKFEQDHSAHTGSGRPVLAILSSTDEEKNRVQNILSNLNLSGRDDIVLINVKREVE